MTLRPYDRAAAAAYAHRWAYGRNPRYYDFEGIGGDCTNFASQCLYAGAGIMNLTPTFGWYYFGVNERSPSWTGVEYLYRFLVRSGQSAGPAAEETALSALEPGDIVQLSFDGETWQHSPVVVAAAQAQTPSEVLVAAHSLDCDNRQLSSYQHQKARYLHILGVWKP